MTEADGGRGGRPYADALAAMRRMIAEHRFPVPGRLPPERELAATLGVGRSTLRKILSRLEAEGTLTRQQGRGTFLGTPPAVVGTDGSAFNVRSLSPRELLDARIMFEPMIAAHAARNVTDQQVRDLSKFMERGEQAHDWETYEHWDRRLHKAIAEAAGNPLVVSFIETVNELRKSETWTRSLLPSIGAPEQQEAMAFHRTIVGCIAAHDSHGAAENMRAHLCLVRSLYFDRVSVETLSFV